MMKLQPTLLPALLLLVTVPTAAQNQRILTTSWSKGQPGDADSAGRAASAAGPITDSIDSAIATKYPCMDAMTAKDAERMLAHERVRQLLGGEPNERLLTEICGAVGARYVVSVGVTEARGTLTVSATMLDGGTGKALAKSVARIAEDEEAPDRVEEFAKAFAASIVGGPKCPGPWTGTITVSNPPGQPISGTTTNGDHWTLSTDVEVSYHVDGTKATCRGRRVMSGTNSKDGPRETVEEGTGEGQVVIGRRNGMVSVSLHVRDLPGTVVVTTPKGKVSGPTKVEMGTWNAEAPAGTDPNKEVGSWSDGKGTTINWTLSR